MRFSFALAALAFAGSLHAQEESSSRFRPYLTADLGIGNLLDVKSEKDDPEFVQDMEDDLAVATTLSVSFGILHPEKPFGLGGFYLNQSSRAENDTELLPGSGSAMVSADQKIDISIIGAQLVALPHLGQSVRLRGELGLGRASVQDFAELTIGDPAGAGRSVTSRVETDYSGLAFVVGAGLDLMLTPRFGIGAKTLLVIGEASVDDVKADVSTSGSQQEVKMDKGDFADADFSSTNVSLGLRFLF